MSVERQRAAKPEDLTRLFVEFANAGDVEGLAGLYEPDAVVAFSGADVRRTGPEKGATIWARSS
jgi:hypothetical protein